jgi:hypothetical protein
MRARASTRSTASLTHVKNGKNRTDAYNIAIRENGFLFQEAKNVRMAATRSMTMKAQA